MGSGKENIVVPSELVDFINSGSKFIITGHKEPDGDCVGSQLALRSVFQRMGKEAIVCSAGPFKRTELKDYVNDFITIPSEDQKAGAKVIIVDCSGIERIGEELHHALKGLPHAVIDHHAAVTHPPSTKDSPVYVDASSPSCTFLIDKLIAALGMELTKDEATLLLFGLCTDTGFFRHLTEKNSQVFEATAKMVGRGASPKHIYSVMNGGKSLDSRILLGRILSRTESYFDGRLMLSYETLEEFKRFGFEGRDSDNLNKMLLSIENVEATVIIRQENDENCTVSLRSVDKIDVAYLAATFGGGGHKNASGLTMKGDILNTKEVILKAFKDFFK
jgi:phosphoesterase RecJ-like protein